MPNGPPPSFEKPLAWISPKREHEVGAKQALAMEIEEARSIQTRKSERLAAKYARSKVKYNTGNEYKKRSNKPRQARLEYLKS